MSSTRDLTKHGVAPPRRGLTLCCVIVAGLVVSACSSGLPELPSVSSISSFNPFKEKEQPLPGRRIPVVEAKDSLPGDLAEANAPIVLGPQVVNADWSQPGGTPANAIGHTQFAGAVNSVWSADAGTGSGSAGRVVAPPIVYQGRVYTLDAAALVRAFNLGSGSAIWQASLIPEEEKSAGSGSIFSLSFSSSTGGGYGGGVAADNGRVYGVSGFGKVAAFDPATGKLLWQTNVGRPVRAAPTAVGDRLFIIARDGHFYCLSGVDGKQLWAVRGIPQQASLVNNVSPAVAGQTVVVPYPSGDLLALDINNGTPIWSENLASSRITSQLASLADAARPAIDNGVVYGVGHGGRMIATSLETGERLWSLDVAGVQTPAVSGDSVFVVDTRGRLLAVSRDAGGIRWTAKLPGAKTWSGPTLAGGKLWLVSNEGQLAGVDAVTGRVVTQQNLGGKYYIPPVVAQGRMLLLSDSASLRAFN